jgi:phosphate-selective porin OprO and OprP
MMHTRLRTGLATAVLVGILAAGGAAPGAAQTAPPFTLNVGARLQLQYVHSFPGAEEQDPFGTFWVRRGRLSVGGAAYERFNYAIQLELAGGGVQLIDANISTPLAPMATLWFGQGKAPFGRQQLTSSGSLNMVDRAITDGRFAPGRQIGIALFGQNQARTFEYGAGVYNGEGPRTPNQNDRFMYVARAVLTPLGAYGPAESAFDYPSTPRVALGGAVMHNTLGSGENETGVLRLGLEGAFKLQGLNVTSELYREQLSPVVGTGVDTNGWYVQGGYLLPDRRNELAARWAVIQPDTPTNTGSVEVGVGHSWYFNAHRAKLQTDLRRLTHHAFDTSDVQLRVQFQLAM